MRTTIFALLAPLVQVAVAVTPLIIKGADFVNSVTGTRFQIVGIAYQPGGSSGFNPGSGIDPLSDGAACLRDATLIQRLGINAIRVYNVDPYINHDLCASIFNLAGIYMLIDVNSPLPNESISRDKPWESYNVGYLNRTFAVVEAFKDYPNTMLFFSGNEVINDAATGKLIPQYMRAVTRDLKNYVTKHSTRPIPIGYSAADVRDVLVDTWNYLQCSTTGDTSDPSRVDLFALNSYSWCGAATFHSSTYDDLVSFFQKTSVPVFFSEYGCREVRPRIFTEVQAIYGPQMTPYLSGGVVFEYIEGQNDFGVMIVNSNGSAQLRVDYEHLQNQYNALDFATLENSTAQNTTNVPPVCSAKLITTSGFSNNFTIPDPPPGAEALINSGLTNPNRGKLVTVSNLKVTQVVQTSNGTIMSGLELKALANDKSNTPTGLNDTSDSTVTTTAPPAATSSKSAARRMAASTSASLMLLSLAPAWFL